MSNALTCMEFIKKIGKAAVKHYKKYRILPSLTIAQAILESGWGESSLATECHNYFGMKWCDGCGCKSKSYRTAEQRTNGTYYTITAKFRKYDTVSDGISGYYEFLQYPRYKNLKGVKNYKTACKLIKKDGWATANEYTARLISLIEQWKLTEYDKLAFESLKAVNPLPQATKPEKPTVWKPHIGDKVKVNGKIYGNGDGSGGKLTYKNQTMYISDIVSQKNYKYFLGVALSKTGCRMGWGNLSTIKKQ